MKCPFCNTDISEHEAGRCLDAWVHRLTGAWSNNVTLYADWKRRVKKGGVIAYIKGYPKTVYTSIHTERLPHYSMDMNEAMKVWMDSSELRRYGVPNNYHWCHTDEGRVYGEAPTPALAICQAFIKEKGERNELR